MTIRRNARSLRFFMRLHEVSATIWERANALDLNILLYGANRHREIASERGTLRTSSGEIAWPVFLAREAPQSLPDYNGIQFGKLGWVELMVPHEHDDVLTMAHVRTQSFWWETNAAWVRGDIPHENLDALILFRDITSAFRKQLQYPVWSYHIRMSPPTLSARRDIAFSSGAADWCLSGRRLRQRGVGYGGFSVDASIHENLATDSTM